MQRMRIGTAQNGWYRPAARPSRTAVEKPSVLNMLADNAETRTEIRPMPATSAPTADMSQIETAPACGWPNPGLSSVFIAQVLGQVLETNKTDRPTALRRYAQGRAVAHESRLLSAA